MTRISSERLQAIRHSYHREPAGYALKSEVRDLLDEVDALVERVAELERENERLEVQHESDARNNLLNIEKRIEAEERLAASERARAALQEALTRVEFNCPDTAAGYANDSQETRFCPACGNRRASGHMTGCFLGAALGAAKAPE